MAKISIIIPVYNAEKYLAGCLDSAINQTFKDIEIIAVNDGSTDNSNKILEQYTLKDSRIKVINQSNKGLSNARNNAINNSNGEYLFFLDSNEYIENNCIELLHKDIVSNNSDMVFCAFNYLQDSEFLYNSAKEVVFFQQYPKKYEAYNILTPIAGKMFKKGFILDNKIYFNEKFGVLEDFEFVFKSVLLGAKISSVSKPLYNYQYIRLNNDTLKGANKNPEIDTLKILLNSDAFKNADDFFKIACIDSFIYTVLSFNQFKIKEQKKRLRTIYKYINKNISEKIFKQCPQYKNIKKFSKNLIQKLFSLTSWKNFIKNHIIRPIRNEIVEISVFNRYKKTLNKIRNKKDKINIIFLISENQKWCFQDLYEQFKKDNRFNARVLIYKLCQLTPTENNARKNLIEENIEFFKKKGVDVELTYKNNKYIPLRDFCPDIVFYEQPWCLPEIYMPSEVSKYALTCYCGYGFEPFDNRGNYMPHFHRLLWKFFADNHINVARYSKHNKKPVKNCVPVGNLKTDTYLNQDKKPAESIWREPNKVKVIYAPHHSFEYGGLHLATFKNNGKYMLEFAKKHPEMTWIFKPHPRFRYSVVSNHIMEKEELENYYKEWEKIGNVYNDGDYYDIFKTSDLLITDCASFLGEYLPTKKPIIHFCNKHSVKYSKFGDMIFQCCYNIYDNEAFEDVIKDLIVNKKDPKLSIREQVIPLLADYREKTSTKIYKNIKNITG